MNSVIGSIYRSLNRSLSKSHNYPYVRDRPQKLPISSQLRLMPSYGILACLLRHIKQLAKNRILATLTQDTDSLADTIYPCLFCLWMGL